MKSNAEILAFRVLTLNARLPACGPRVGDFLKLSPPDPRCADYTRFTHDWGDTIQTGGTVGGAYYMGDGYLSYSGGLDPGVKKAELILTKETKAGHVWFFDGDISGAGRGVDFEIPFRVFTHRPGADLSGVWELVCPYYVSALTEEQHKGTCGYWFTVTKHGMSHTAFRLKTELLEWAKKERLSVPANIDAPGYYRLAFASNVGRIV